MNAKSALVDSTSKPVVIIYRNELLSHSETFIPAQAEALTRFTPIYVGIKKVGGLQLPRERCIVFSSHTNNRLAQLASLRRKLLGPTSVEIQRLRALQPRLIHAHFGIDAVQAMPLARALNIPLLATFHGFDATMDDAHIRRSSLAGRLYVRRRSELKRQAARVICVSNFIRRAVLLQGFDPAKTLIHYIGLDTEFFAPSTSIQRSRIVLFVGRLVEKKGCEFLIRAMDRLQRQRVDARLIVVGDGPLRTQLEGQARATLSNFEFLGQQSSQQIKELMRRAMVFCAPSIVAESGDSEGFGMVFLEAQSMGLPVVSFDSGGIAEAVEHERTGLLAPSHDVTVLTQYLARLLTSSETWESFSEAGRRRVCEQFDVRKQSRKLEDLYFDLLS